MRALYLLLLVVVVVAVAVGGVRADRRTMAHLELAPTNFERETEADLPETHWLSPDRASICTAADPADASSPSDRNGPTVTCYSRVFEPTDTFEPVRIGQLLPKGLHVRVNMQTGVKHAARMAATPDAGSDADAKVVAAEPVDAAAGALQVVPRTVREPEVEPEYESTVTPLTPERKAELDALWDQLMAVARRETELLLAALRTLRDPAATEDALLTALDTMEDVVHHIDYGRDLVAMDGIAPIMELLGHASPAVRAHAAGVLGAALQRYALGFATRQGG